MRAEYRSPARKKNGYFLKAKKYMVGVLHAPFSTPGGTCLIETLTLEQKRKMVRKPTEAAPRPV